MATFNATSGPDANGVYQGEECIYVDGELFAGPTSQRYRPQWRYQLDMGVNPDSAWRYTGYIDEVALVARAWTANEAKDHYQMPSP